MTGDIEDEELVVPETGVEIGTVGIEELPNVTRVGVETDEEPVVELELSEAGPTTAAVLLEEEVDKEDEGPVGGELKPVEADEEDELLVVTLIGPTAGLELEELPVVEMVEEDELFVVMLIGPTTTEPELEVLLSENLLDKGGAVDGTEELKLLGLELDELVGTVLEELEVVVDPQPGIVV